MTTFVASGDADGFAIVRNVLDSATIESLRAEFPSDALPERNLFSYKSIRELARSKAVRDIVEPLLGSSCFAVRALLFNKTADANWKVAWHQDLKIAVREKRDAAGFGAWSVKDGAVHVEPPAEVLERMVAVRIHLDANTVENGPLRCVPGSHKLGRLAHEQIVALDKSGEVACLAQRGDILLMRPLVVHASSACAVVAARRVVHLEFAMGDLAGGLEWRERI